MVSATKISAVLSELSQEDLLSIARRALEIGGVQPFNQALKPISEKLEGYGERGWNDSWLEELREQEAGRDPGEPAKKRTRREQRVVTRTFDLSNYAARDIALWISYDGDNYCGFAEQKDEFERTTSVEAKIFEALKKCCLVVDREQCNYSRCGRTDKGVSALGQVIGLRVRSTVKIEDVGDDGLAPPVSHPGDALPSGKAEQDYALMLNRCLPDDIRAIAWHPTAPGFSARFSAGARVYRYFFPGAGYDVERMRDAARRLVGHHDFRNFCKMDVLHVSNFKRTIHEVSITASGTGAGTGEAVWCFEIRGQAFLWHMVRCIVSVLFLVGEGLEAPTVVDAMLDVDAACERRPQYDLAPEDALVLHSCEFDTLRPLPLPENLLKLTNHHESLYAHAATMLARHRNSLETTKLFHVRTEDFLAFAQSRAVPVDDDDPLRARDHVPWNDALRIIRAAQMAKRQAAYTPLLQRQAGLTYEERVAELQGRKKEVYEETERKRAKNDSNFNKEMRKLG